MNGDAFWHDERFMSMVMLLVFLLVVNFVRDLDSGEFLDLGELLMMYGGFQSAAFSGTRIGKQRVERAAFVAKNGSPPATS